MYSYVLIHVQLKEEKRKEKQQIERVCECTHTQAQGSDDEAPLVV